MLRSPVSLSTNAHSFLFSEACVWIITPRSRASLATFASSSRVQLTRTAAQNSNECDRPLCRATCSSNASDSLNGLRRLLVQRGGTSSPLSIMHLPTWPETRFLNHFEHFARVIDSLHRQRAGRSAFDQFGDTQTRRRGNRPASVRFHGPDALLQPIISARSSAAPRKASGKDGCEFEQNPE